MTRRAKAARQNCAGAMPESRRPNALRNRVLCDLVLPSGITHRAIRQVRRIQFHVEFEQQLVLRRFDLNRPAAHIDGRKAPAAKCRNLMPILTDSLFAIAAID